MDLELNAYKQMINAGFGHNIWSESLSFLKMSI